MRDVLKKVIYAVLVIAVLGVVVISAYLLPKTVKVTITGTDIRPTSGGQQRNGKQNSISSLFFVYAKAYKSGAAKTFVNHDAAFWPPYFKFNSGTVQSQASQFASPSNQAVLATYYGWRLPLFGAYPNLVDLEAIKPNEGPGVPIFNILYFIVLAGVVIYLFMRVRRLFPDD